MKTKTLGGLTQLRNPVIKEHDTVRLTEIVDHEGSRYQISTTGAVVSVYNDGQAFAIEVVDGLAEPTVITVLASQVEAVP